MSLKDRAAQALIDAREAERLRFEAEKLAHAREAERLCRAWLLEHFQTEPDALDVIGGHRGFHRGLHRVHIVLDGQDLVWTDDPPYYGLASYGNTDPPCVFFAKAHIGPNGIVHWQKGYPGNPIRSLAALGRDWPKESS